LLAIAAAPIEFRTVCCRRRYQSHPSVRLAIRALQRTTFAEGSGFHSTFQNRNVITSINVASIKMSPITIRTPNVRGNTSISGRNLSAYTISGSAASANTMPRTAHRTTDDRRQMVRNQRIAVAVRRATKVVELLGVGVDTSSNEYASALPPIPRRFGGRRRRSTDHCSDDFQTS
jgi:hypothetical protein